jgi:hypothetical protein
MHPGVIAWRNAGLVFEGHRRHMVWTRVAILAEYREILDASSRRF